MSFHSQVLTGLNYLLDEIKILQLLVLTPRRTGTVGVAILMGLRQSIGVTICANFRRHLEINKRVLKSLTTNMIN